MSVQVFVDWVSRCAWNPHQQLHKGQIRPSDDGDIVGVSFDSEAGFALIPNVGDVVNIPEMEGHAGVSGVVKSRLFNYLTGEKPVSAELVESVLSRQLDDLEPTLTRHGYRIKDLVEQFDARPTEIKALFSNALDPARTTELRDRMLAAGLPI